VDVPVIQQAKIQAQVLVPLVKALQAEIGRRASKRPLFEGRWVTSIVATAKSSGGRRMRRTSGKIMASCVRQRTPARTLLIIE